MAFALRIVEGLETVDYILIVVMMQNIAEIDPTDDIGI